MNSPSSPARPRRFVSLLPRVGLVVLLALAALLLARQALFRGPFQPVTPLPAESPIIDLHCHTAGIGAGGSGCFVSPRLRSNFRYRIYLDAFGVTESNLVEHGDIFLLEKLSREIAASRHLDAAVILALDGVIDDAGQLDLERTEILIPNEFIADATQRFTNLLFGASIHPRRPDALARLDQAAAQGAVLVKWIPSIMDIDPADPRFIPFYQRLTHHGIPLLSHTGPERSFTSSQDELAHPDRLTLALDHGVTVIAAHTAAGGETDGRPDLETLRRLMAKYPNLHADISALTQGNRFGALQATLEAPECRGRLVYGSDFPLINTALVSPWYYPLNLTESQRQQISALTNAWDRDIALKQALGVPAEIFEATARLLRLPSRSSGTNAASGTGAPLGEEDSFLNEESFLGESSTYLQQRAGLDRMLSDRKDEMLLEIEPLLLGLGLDQDWQFGSAWMLAHQWGIYARAEAQVTSKVSNPEVLARLATFRRRSLISPEESALASLSGSQFPTNLPAQLEALGRRHSWRGGFRHPDLLEEKRP